MAVLLAVSALVPARGGEPPPAEATAYHINPAHTGYSPAQISPPLHRRWVRDFDGSVSYPLIADGKVFVFVNSETEGWTVKGLSARTGATLWSRGFSGYILGTTLEDETLFVLSSGGRLTALRADTGHPRWQTILSEVTPAYSYSALPTAWRGMVFVSGGGEGVSMLGIDARTGAVRWTQHVDGSGSSPAAAGQSVFVAFPSPQVYALATGSGGLQWHVGAFPHGGGGYIPTYYRGRVYAMEYDTGLVLDSATGGLVDSYWSEASPAVHGETLLLLENGLLHALSRDDHAHRWWFRSRDGTRLVSSPLIVNSHAYIASAGGTVYALGLAGGRVLWQTSTGSSVFPSRHRSGGGALPGMAAGGGLLLVPAQSRLVAYAD